MVKFLRCLFQFSSRSLALADIAMRNCFRVLWWGLATATRSICLRLQRKVNRVLRAVMDFVGAEPVAPVFLTLARAQFALVVVGLSSSVVLATMAPSTEMVRERLALAEWGDHVAPWSTEVEAFALRITQGYGVRHDVAMEFAPWILEASERQQLEPELLAGLILTESSFRKNVTSPVGAIGPAQVRPEFWSQFCGTGELGDPAENIYCGAQILAYYKERCGGEDCALQAYNIGPYSGRLQAGQRYVTKVGQWRDALVNISI